MFDSVVKNVDLLLQLNIELNSAKLQTKIDQIKTQINYCEGKINAVIYRLYGLTDGEIKIVEGKADD